MIKTTFPFKRNITQKIIAIIFIIISIIATIINVAFFHGWILLLVTFVFGTIGVIYFWKAIV